MTRHIAWQAALAALGIGLVSVILFQLASSQTPTAAVAVPAVGGTYVEGILGYSETINPILAPAVVQANPVDQDLCTLVFDGLTSVDSTGQIVPSLAMEWDVSEDGTVYEFHMRQDVTWHDGAPFTAADAAFTVQAMQDPDYQGPSALRELWRSTTVEAVDEYTVRFTLHEPFPSFLQYTSIGLLPAHLLGNVPASDLPEHVFSKQRPVGTGQFMVESVSPDQVTLTANPDYWGPQPYLAQVAFWFYADWDGLLTDYSRGEIHGFHPSPQVLAALTTEPDVELYSAQSAGCGIVYLNLTRESAPFFQDKEVRQALLYAADRQALIDLALNGQGLVAHSPMLPATWVYDPSVRQYPYDPERAIGLLDASGWVDSDADRIRDKDGVALAFSLLTSEEPAMIRLAEELIRQWRAVGIDVRTRSASSELLTRSVRARSFDAALIEIRLSADPDPYPLWHSTQAESGQNFAGFANEDADLVMEEARLTTDAQRRVELYQTFQQIFAEEVPSLLLFYPIYTYAVDADVRGVQLSPLLHSSDRFRNITDWYIQTEEIAVGGTEQLDKSQE